MGQLNMHLTPEFEKMLHRFMRKRQLKTKSEAIRIAVKEGCEHAQKPLPKTDFVHWIGAAKHAPLNPNPKFESDDALWS